MAGVDSVLRLVGAIIVVPFLIFVGWVGVTLWDPIYNNVIDVGLMQSLGWGAPQDTVYLFAALGIIGLLLVVAVWLLVGHLREDVRQDTGRPGPPM